MKASLRHLLWFFLPLVLILISCDRADMRYADSVSKNEREASMPDMAPAPSPPQAVTSGGAAMDKVAAPVAPQQVLDSATAMIIRTGTAQIEVDSLETSVAALRALVLRVGGMVANSSMQTGREHVRSATLELKIPATRFDEAVNGLEPLGEVESVQIGTQDVGEEYVDVNARVANARRLEQRLIALLDTRTGKLEDVLAVERELARVREEIDRLEGRLRYLRTRVAMSTLTVLLHEAAPLVSNPGENVLLQSFVRAWQNFVRFIAGLIAALGYLIPLAVLVAALRWLLLRLVPRLRRRPRPSEPGTPA